MSQRCHKRTRRSKRELQKLSEEAVKVDLADDQATFQMVLPMKALLAEEAQSIEAMSCHKLLSLKLKAAWGMTDYAEAKRALEKVYDCLATINIAAARSLEEGFEEPLTVNRSTCRPNCTKSLPRRT